MRGPVRALRPGDAGGGMLGVASAAIDELIAIEAQLACYARDADAPAAVRARRDALLAQLGG